MHLLILLRGARKGGKLSKTGYRSNTGKAFTLSRLKVGLRFLKPNNNCPYELDFGQKYVPPTQSNINAKDVSPNEEKNEQDQVIKLSHLPDAAWHWDFIARSLGYAARVGC